MTLATTYTILRRTDTSEYLSHFLFFDPQSMAWTKNLDEVFCFRSHSDAEANGRLILDRLNDPTNRRVRLKCAKAAVKNGELEIGESYPLCVARVA